MIPVCVETILKYSSPNEQQFGHSHLQHFEHSVVTVTSCLHSLQFWKLSMVAQSLVVGMFESSLDPRSGASYDCCLMSLFICVVSFIGDVDVCAGACRTVSNLDITVWLRFMKQTWHSSWSHIPLISCKVWFSLFRICILPWFLNSFLSAITTHDHCLS